MKLGVRIFLLISALVLTQNTSASYSRLQSMGKNSTFIMDDMSIFDNPANIGIYPNYLIGEIGEIGSTPDGAENHDPQRPWFGGIFSLSLGGEDSGDPRVSIAGAFNRHDELLFSFIPDTVLIDNNQFGVDSIGMPAPSTNFDGFLGASTESGNLYGLHIYIAHQEGANLNDNSLNIDTRARSSVFKIDGGMNWKVAGDIDGEVSLGLGRIMYGNFDDDEFWDTDMLSLFFNARMFSTIEMLNGELVPALKYHSIKTMARSQNLMDVGMGVNVSMEKGFFWLGFQFFNLIDEYANNSYYMGGSEIYYYSEDLKDGGIDQRTENGLRVSFGIERSLWWDWFVIRVGGNKVISYVECDLADNTLGRCGDYNIATSGNYMNSNPVGNGMADDHVGVGIGVNVEGKLRIDAVLAEDIFYKNPFSGKGNWVTRLSSTYSF